MTNGSYHGVAKMYAPVDAHQGISEQALDSGSEAIQPEVDNTKWLPMSISSDGVRFLVSPKAFLDKASNSIAILIRKTTVPDKELFWKDV